MMTTNLPPKVRPGDSVRATAFNALIDAIRGVMPIAGRNVRISYSSAGAKIDVVASQRAGGGSAAVYWTVSYDEDKGWLIDIPVGSTTFSTTVHLPRPQGETDGPYSLDGSAQSDGDYEVVVHFKREVRVGSSSVPVPIVYAEIHSASATGRGPYAGDVYSFVAATVSVTTEQGDGGGQTTTRRIVQQYAAPVDAVEPSVPTASLGLYWSCSAVGSSGWNSFRPSFHADDDAPLCGGTLDVTESVPYQGDATLYYLIDCSGSTPAPKVTSTAQSGYSVVCKEIYRLKDGAVVSDTRADIWQLVFYP